jgi:hypothetical protein
MKPALLTMLALAALSHTLSGCAVDAATEADDESVAALERANVGVPLPIAGPDLVAVTASGTAPTDGFGLCGRTRSNEFVVRVKNVGNRAAAASFVTVVVGGRVAVGEVGALAPGAVAAVRVDTRAILPACVATAVPSSSVLPCGVGFSITVDAGRSAGERTVTATWNNSQTGACVGPGTP